MMDKLSEHAVRMLEIVDNERGFYKDMDGEVADMARAVYDVILQVQMLKMADRKVSEKSTGSSDSEKPNNCETCRFYHPDYEAIACERCLDGKYSRYEPRCSHTDCYYYDHFDADVCGRCTSKDEQTEREGE